MHFAVGMAGAGAITAAGCLIIRKSPRWIPAAMTLGGIWAIVPDLPRIFREDFPSLPLASILGSKNLETQLHAIGDLFFLHARLDAQPKEFALHGLAGILLLYNAGIILQLILERRARNTHEVHQVHKLHQHRHDHFSDHGQREEVIGVKEVKGS